MLKKPKATAPDSTAQKQEEGKQVLFKKEWFIKNNTDAVLQRYNFANKIGEGAFGEVYKATLIGTDLVRAVKVIRKNKVAEPTRLAMEINLMKKLDHPNLVKLYETYQTETEIYLIMEFCEGGELFSRIEGGNKMSENEAKQIFRDITQAINYLHLNNVCHRDLKPENFLFLDKRPNSILKLTDFGLSTTVSESSNKLKSMVGTVYYISPEVLQSEYQISCDVWSMGVILIVLLTGSAPFEGEKDDQIMSNIMQRNAIIPQDVSSTGKNLISRCLMPATKRIKAEEILDHPWMINKVRAGVNGQKLELAALKKYTQANRFKKLVLNVIASQMKSKDVEDLTTQFKALNTKNNGVLSKEEILAGFKKTLLQKYKEEEVEKIVGGLDQNKADTVSYTEFIAATMEPSLYLKPKYLKIAFDLLDKEQSGSIDLGKLRDILCSEENGEAQKKHWKEMVKEIGQTETGKISFEEFVAIMEK